MFNIRKTGVHAAVASLALTLAALGLDAAASEVEPTKAAKQDSEHEHHEVSKTAKQKGALTTQQELDLKHELVQTDGVDHPREIAGVAKKLKSAAKKKASPATQKDKDLEHDMVQGDGVNHPREVLKK